jgi:hypothetical protein
VVVWRALATVAAVVLLITACAPSPLGKIEVSPPAPSPDLRNTQNRFDVHYRLNRPAVVSAFIQSSDGARWTVYDNAARPRAGDYVLQFDGTVAGPGASERTVLPDGDYQLALVVDSGAVQQQTQVPLSIRNADSTPPDVSGLNLMPGQISPNFDAREDVTNATFQLAKRARVALFLDKTDASGQIVRIWQSDEVKLPAGEQALTFDGQINGVPVANGQYQLGVRARDDAGNVVERSAPLQVEGGGVPDATLVSVRIGPLQIIRGNQVCIDAVVRNTGQTVLRTEGPDPGYVYTSQDTFSSIADHAYVEHAGFWRLGLSSSGTTDTNGATYPYRWGFGHDLQPGEEAPVHGCVQVLNEQDKLVYFASLVQENVAIHSPGAGMVRVDISS